MTATGLSGGGYEYEWNDVVRIWRCPKDRMQELVDTGRIRYTKNGVAEYIRYLDEMPGVPLQDVWTDIFPVNPMAKERLGYPTQKPEALLERIIEASSNEGDVVLDPFCGCGTTIAVAEKLHRHWMGIDITHLAITLMVKRLVDTFGEELHDFEIIGDPKDVGGAEELAHQNRHQFEWWALSLVGARPAQDKKKGADKGVAVARSVKRESKASGLMSTGYSWIWSHTISLNDYSLNSGSSYILISDETNVIKKKASL
jgi:hypothetical protein